MAHHDSLAPLRDRQNELDIKFLKSLSPAELAKSKALSIQTLRNQGISEDEIKLGVSLIEKEVTIEKIKIDKAQISWRLNAFPAPKTDLAVHGLFRSKRWAVIPKESHHSEEFKDSLYGSIIEILSLPTVSIVGKGVVVDLERLQKTLPIKTRGNHIIPVDYDFPMYKVGEPSKLEATIPAQRAEFKSSNPPDGGELAANASLTLTFSAAPKNVTINGKPATVAGKTAILAGPHTPGQTAFAIAWDNGPGGVAGSATITLNVKGPDTTAPTITRKNFRSKNADTEPLNKDGVIIEFSEPIARHSLKLTLEDGTDLGWAPKVDGTKVTFEPLKGKELGNDTTYIVQGRVEDAAGNKTVIRELFVTRLKE